MVIFINYLLMDRSMLFYPSTSSGHTCTLGQLTESSICFLIISKTHKDAAMPIYYIGFSEIHTPATLKKMLYFNKKYVMLISHKL